MDEIRERITVADSLRMLNKWRVLYENKTAAYNKPTLHTLKYRIPAHLLSWSPVQWDSLRPYFESIEIDFRDEKFSWFIDNQPIAAPITNTKEIHVTLNFYDYHIKKWKEKI